MATLAKKIHIRNSAGVEQTALIYSTTAESGTPYMYASDGSTTGYVPLCDPSDARATSGRVTKSGTTYAIGSSAGPAYDYQYTLFTSSGTFTVPSGVTKLRVTCVGGGAGVLTWVCSPDSAEISYLAQSYQARQWFSSGGGGASSFGTVSAAGGAGSKIQTGDVYTAGDGSRDSPSYKALRFDSGTIVLGSGRTNAVSGSCCSQKPDAAGYTIKRQDTGASLGTFGYGGGGGDDHGGDTVCAIIGATGYVSTATITVTPGQVISAVVGTGGTATNATLGWAYYVRNGGAGCVFVEYGRSIT